MARSLVVAAVAVAVSTSCSSEPARPPRGDGPSRPAAAPTTQAELEQLRSENAALREQLGLARREAAASRDRADELKAENASVERGELHPGMTVQEAHKAITGSAILRRDTCQLITQTPDKWVYRIRPDDTAAGPGSGGASAVGTNMRGAVPAASVSWVCTFDASTGTLKEFRREK